jgi:hypothetical protein
MGLFGGAMIGAGTPATGSHYFNRWLKHKNMDKCANLCAIAPRAGVELTAGGDEGKIPRLGLN